MSDADKAYQAAKRRIAKAKKSGTDSLSFDTDATRALEVLPPEIAALDKLRSLDLDNTKVTDLKPLAGLVELTVLHLSNTKVTNLTPLAGMVGMTALSLTNTKVTDLSPLTGLVGMTALSLNHTKVTDLTPLAGLVGMRALSLINTQITDLTPLTGLVGMTRLWLDNTGVTDLTPLAGMVGMTVLWLSNTKVTDLTPLAGLVGMEGLYLDNTGVTDLSPLTGLLEMTQLSLNHTKVTDLSPIAGLVRMTRLRLDGCAVSDLRPILAMEKLVSKPFLGGLNFSGCAATKLDGRIAEIAKMEDDSERAKALFAYLQDWVPPGEMEAVPDDLLPILLTNGRLEIARSVPSEAEVDDSLKRALHERLRIKAADLARVAGNTQGRLAGRARSLVARLDCPFADLDMINIHMDVEDLATSLRTNPDRVGEDRYSPDIVDALTDVASIGPGLTLDNVDVEKLEDRKRRFVANPPGPDVMAAHNSFTRAVAADVAAIGDNLRALEARIVDRESEPSSGALQLSTHRDMLIRVVRLALVGSGLFAYRGAENALWQFVYDNWGTIVPLANSYGAGFAQWFMGIMTKVSDFAGLVAHVEVKPVLRRRAPK